MEQQGQNGRKEMYILSLDNNRIFWILSIALLVLVFLFLLGYWIGQDNTGDSTQANNSQPIDRSVDARLGQVFANRKLSISQSTAGGNTVSKTSGIPATSTTDHSIGKTDPVIKPDTLSPQHKKEWASLNKGKRTIPVKVDSKPNITKKRRIKPVVRKSVKRSVRRTVNRSTVRRRSSSLYTSSGKYAIQVASLGTSGSASRLKSRLASRSFRAYISRATVNGKLYYRIKVGRFSTYTKARQVLASLKRTREGSRSYIVTN